MVASFVEKPKGKRACVMATVFCTVCPTRLPITTAHTPAPCAARAASIAAIYGAPSEDFR